MPSTTAAAQITYPAPTREESPNELAAQVPPATTPAVWEITNDRINHITAVRVAFADDICAHDISGRKHLLRLRQQLVCTAHREQPSASSITGEVEAVVEMETGEIVTVDVGLQVTATGVDASGYVTLDGRILLDRHWSSTESAIVG